MVSLWLDVSAGKPTLIRLCIINTLMLGSTDIGRQRNLRRNFCGTDTTSTMTKEESARRGNMHAFVAGKKNSPKAILRRAAVCPIATSGRSAFGALGT